MLEKILLPIFFSLLPPFLWLVFYLKRDAHPEPKIMIALAFFTGYLSAFFAYFFEQIFYHYFFSILSFNLLVLIFAFGEEFLKLFVFKKIIQKNKEYDEPVDAMIYLVIIALGFSGLENLMDFLQPFANPLFFLKNAFFRFISSVFLHSLTAGLMGLFIGWAFYKKKIVQRIMELTGLFFATFFHFLYNLVILENFANIFLLGPKIIIFLLASLFLINLYGFHKLKQIKWE